MTTTKRRSRKTHAERPVSGGTVAAAPQVKATTFRLDPVLQKGLAVLGEVLHKPLNRLVNEAVGDLIEKRSVEVQAELESTLERLRAIRKKDPHFETAIADFIEAEARFGHDDPVEGQSRPTAGPAQTKVHELLRG